MTLAELAAAVGWLERNRRDPEAPPSRSAGLSINPLSSPVHRTGTTPTGDY